MADCSCIKGNEGYLFHTVQRSCSHFLYSDLSDWMDEDYYVTPAEYSVEIKVPNASNFVTVQVSTSDVTKITSEDLSVGGSCLPDGVYCIKTEEICGVSYTSFFALTYKLECCIIQLLIQAQTPEDWDELKILQLKIEQIHEAARQGNSKLASDLYSVVRRLLSRKKCTC